MKFSRDYLRDRIYACWIGKNIGGTIGTPYEGGRDILDVKGFKSEPGQPLANDDLDLQLAWLRCVDELGPQNVNSKTLGEYWLSYVKPHWNEYGVGKSNMRGGILPPLSGQIHNSRWYHSNGAWIRTEIWASLYPGDVERAIRYAFEDASVDHGFEEGSYAAIFVAAMESAAYVISDLRTLLKIGLSKIPDDCRVARAVQLVIQEYDAGTDWRETRQKLVKQSEDIGWFQAPANVGYVVLGLLYGECDFKRSVLTAVNCGDDTDCTGATTGALLGIMKGMEGIPEDWQQYIGDDIVNVCLLGGHGRFPKSCTELTDNVMNLLPVTLRTNMQRLYRTGPEVEICDVNDFSGYDVEKLMGTAFVDELKARSRYSFSIEGVFCNVIVCFDREPVIAENGELSGRLMFKPVNLPEDRQLRMKWYLPEGWHVAGRKSVHVNAWECPEVAFTITAGENVEAANTVLIDITAPDRPTHIDVPLTILG